MVEYSKSFEVGDEVTIVNFRAWNGITIEKLTSVVEVKKKYIVLQDGSKWESSGYRPFGNKDKYYTGASVRYRQPDDFETMKIERAIYRISNFNDWKELPKELLFTVDSAIYEYKKKKEEK